MKQKFLSDEDFTALFNFSEQCDDCDADGYTIRKSDMKRLAELGVVQSHGFGRYSVTAFGDWIIETEFEQNPTLPLKTVVEHN